MNFYKDNDSLKFHLTHPEMKKIATLKEQNFADHGVYEGAPADADDALEKYDLIMDLVGEIAGNVVAPNAEEVDHVGPHINEEGRVVYAPGTQQNHDTLQRAGLYGFSLPRKYQGLNFPYVAYIMTSDIIARADVGFATIWGLQDCAETISTFASEELKERFIPRIYQGATCSMDLTEPDAGSDLQSVRLKATYDEASKCWRLNGVKRFITNGDADIHLVLARSEEGTTDGRGLSYFVYDRAEGGLTVRRIENKMGIKGSPTAELVFTNAPAYLVGERRLGLIKYVMTLMNDARLGVGSQSVGLCEACCREAEQYASEREQFGHAINQFPAVRDLLTAMRARTDGARSLLYETARMVDLYKAYESQPGTLSGDARKDYKQALRNADILTPILKLSSSEFSNRNAYDCIQVHGGSGFMKEYACERLYRDARILSIYEGTSQLQVVAAQKGIANGAYLAKIEEYDSRDIDASLLPLRELLRKATADYRELYDLQNNYSGDGMDFKRMLTDTLSAIIMGYLLLDDTTRQMRDPESCGRSFAESARWMCAYAYGESQRSLATCKAYCNM
ncbi:MAG: acyl-CoA dehydrogenase family protein [Bacteroidales bacterium]|nr:acyl-CoA dehydrogenase family protein [Bacteroidales bacterium]